MADLLKTATAEELDVLKQSLNNFNKKLAEKNEEDEYIEEVFEVDVKEEESADSPLQQSIVELSEEEMIKLK